MSSPLQNTNALKWTPEVVKEILVRIEQESLNETTYFLGTAMCRQRLSRHLWSYWRKKFAGDESIIEHMDLIEQMFENNLFEAALRAEVNIAVAIFALKNNHRWTDRPVIELIREELKSEGMIIELTEGETVHVPALQPKTN